jgi:hypothetical protein
LTMAGMQGPSHLYPLITSYERDKFFPFNTKCISLTAV